MPIIMRHQPEDWKPTLPWPDDGAVQWGASGLVIGKSGARRTAFFEVFPHDGAGGYIRGEGDTLDDAEQNAFSKWERQLQCYNTGGHRWSRHKRLNDGKTKFYFNGNCYCIKCGASEMAMRPIVKLGDWRIPLRDCELSLLFMGAGRPEDGSAKSKKLARNLELRAHLFNLQLPDWRDSAFKEQPEWPETGPYDEACQKAVAEFYATHYKDHQKHPSGESLFASIMNGMGICEIHEHAVKLGLIEESLHSDANT